ncbi:MAG: hypothetical protein GOU97_02205 [Nanoarchaeota archaeon]|nr:hypothetical protein [Nanoarchaeota archaeon]
MVSIDDEFGVEDILGMIKKKDLNRLEKLANSLPRDLPYVRESLQIAGCHLKKSVDDQVEGFDEIKGDLARSILLSLAYFQKLYRVSGEKDLKTV